MSDQPKKQELPPLETFKGIYSLWWEGAPVDAYLRSDVDAFKEKALVELEALRTDNEAKAARIAELEDGLRLIRLALRDEAVDGIAPWTRMRFWLNQRDIYNGDLQGHAVTLAVVEALLATVSSQTPPVHSADTPAKTSSTA